MEHLLPTRVVEKEGICMSYVFQPITERVQKIREKYRNTQPELDINRFKIVTEFYESHDELTGILKRAYNFKNLCEKLPLFVDEDELIVGSMVTKFRAAAMYPENSIDWLIRDLKDRSLMTRKQDPYICSEETRQYVLDHGDFWMTHSMLNRFNPYIPETYRDLLADNGCCQMAGQGQGAQPVGHFCANYNKAVNQGFQDTYDMAVAKVKKLEEKGIYGDSINQYNFYRAIKIVCEGFFIFAERYSKYTAELAAKETNPTRKAELEKISSNCGWVMRHGARDFHEGVQALWMYQLCVMMDANLHGTSLGRVDQYLGHLAEADLASGKLTRAQEQEIMDCFMLKVAELNKPWSEGPTLSVPGYTSGQNFTLGGQTRDGKDATNVCTFLCLESAGRLVLHDPPQSLRLHPGTPDELWECAIEVNKKAGGVPSFYSDPVIFETLKKAGRLGGNEEDIRDYCIIGCVEPAGCGNEWPACGGNGTESFTNMVNGFLMAINNGINPMPKPDGSKRPQQGPATGYLYEMNSMEEVKEAYRKQMEFWIRWHVNCTNAFEYVYRETLPQPVVSASMEGCMEKGMDVTYGGAKYNSTGTAGVGIGNVADSLNVIDYLCFKTKKVTTRELYDAIMANWEGYEELRNYINGEVPRYGNADSEADKYVAWAAKVWADYSNAASGPRGRVSAGLYPVTMNVLFGFGTWATPDGRKAMDPLSDGMSAVQQMDKNGPTAELTSVSHIDQTDFSNGTLLNMKFHPTAVSNDAGKAKLRALMETYFFKLGGMQLQMNIVSADMMRAAQADPAAYKDLVVRIAGFSAYFVEVFKAAQDDLIRRTELSL